MLCQLQRVPLFSYGFLGGKRQSGTASLMRGPSQAKSSQVKLDATQWDKPAASCCFFLQEEDVTTWPLFYCVRPAALRLSGGQSTLGRRTWCWPMPGLCWCARWLRRGGLWVKGGQGRGAIYDGAASSLQF